MWSMLIGPVSEVINTVLKRILPAEKMSETERAKLEAEILLELSKQDWSAAQAQLEINKQEAKHESVFVSGWRPFVGWVCGSALAYHFVLQPSLVFFIALFKWQVPPLPAFDMDSLLTVLLGMLGLGGMRTYEKFKGVNKSR